MKKRLMTRAAGMALAVSVLLAATACSSQEDSASNTGSGENGSVNAGADAESERETIKVSLGRQTLQNVSFPNGDTYEDNAYVRMAEKKLNIDITDEFEANGDDYDRQVSLALTAGDIPDMMKVIYTV